MNKIKTESVDSFVFNVTVHFRLAGRMFFKTYKCSPVKIVCFRLNIFQFVKSHTGAP